ncbi:MAG: SLC13 family permease [Candidatus Brocadiia bacterium]
MTPEILTVLAVLFVTVLLIVTEALRIDVVAILALLSLVWLNTIEPAQALSGFSSNAVIAIIAVMILGRGLFKSGITYHISSFILSIAGTARRRIVGTISLTVGIMSGFMQNIGAAALFLPVMVGISKREKIPVASLLMPMGFAALLGGTLTMVGTSSLIVLNDLLEAGGRETFNLFSVTPIGITLLLSGILFFFLFGNMIFPSGPGVSEEGHEESEEPAETLINIWGLSDTIYTFRIGEGSSLIGRSLKESGISQEYNLILMGIGEREGSDFDIWQDVEFEQDQRIVVQGLEEDIRRFAEDKDLDLHEQEMNLQDDDERGYIEVVIPMRSKLVGKSIRDLALRETYQAQVVRYFSGREVVEEGIADRKIQAGDTFILQGKWENLKFFKESQDYIAVTPFPVEQEVAEKKTEKAVLSVCCFVGAIASVFLLGVPISIGFLTGAFAMILTGVLSIEDAYRAVEWKVVFLISGLLPIGIAMKETGTATYLAENIMSLMSGSSTFIILLAIGALTTIFSLFMSNVAATVLLVPIVLEIATDLHLDPRAIVLLVGVCAANSFIIPTHHVNALLMTPGGYKVKDYLKAGSGLSVLFLVVSVSFIYFFYLP